MTAPLLLANTSVRMRAGCKGPAAEGWLAQFGITVPRGANRYSIGANGLLAARLATAEFLFESMQAEATSALEPTKNALELTEMPSGVYPVLRQDFVIEIAGAGRHDLFAQTCAVDLVPIERESSPTAGPVVLTSMIGVAVVIACLASGEGPRFTVWSDPSYSHYFWSELAAIVTGLGGEVNPASPTRSGGLTP